MLQQQKHGLYKRQKLVEGFGLILSGVFQCWKFTIFTKEK